MRPLFAKNQNQQELNQAAFREFQKSDDALNQIYSKLFSALNRFPERQAKLKAAQRAWILFRDADSAYFASEMEGGSAYPLLDYGARKRLTIARTKDLEERLNSLRLV